MNKHFILILLSILLPSWLSIFAEEEQPSQVDINSQTKKTRQSSCFVPRKNKKKVTSKKVIKQIEVLPPEVNLTPNFEKVSNKSPCTYKKKIAITTFKIINNEHIFDTPRLGYEFAKTLGKMLHESQNFIVRDVEDVNIFDNQSPQINSGYELQDNTGLIYLAAKIDAQFIISGIIRDLSIRKSLFADKLGFLNRLNEREIKMEIFIYDGLSGALIERKNYEKTAKGQIYFSNPIYFSNEEITQSDIGKSLNAIINEQVNDISNKIKCLPLMEKILKVDQEGIYFNAGALQNINVGDSFFIYSTADKYANAVYYKNIQLYGYLERERASLIVKQVQPLFSIGILDKTQNHYKVYPSDIIKSNDE